MEIQHFSVPANHLVLPRKPVDTNARVPGSAKITEYSRISGIKLQSFGNYHRRGLQLESMVEKGWDRGHAGALIITEPAQEVLSFQRIAVVFQSSIERGHLVTHIVYCDPWSKQVGRKDDRAIRHANLRVLECFCVGLALLIFIAPAEVGPKAGSELLMVFKVAKARPKFAGCGSPHQS